MSQQGPVLIIDPSELHRPESKYIDYNALKRMKKERDAFRQFNDNLQTARVRETYSRMHKEQTFDTVTKKKKSWGKLDKMEKTLMDAIISLDDVIDASDPDSDLPNSVHAFQTAERIRQKYPDLDWFHLVGLLHDTGKVMALAGEEQHFVVGDTFPLGCKFSDSIVFPEFFKDNPDYHHPVYSTQYGCYEPNCGLDNVLMSWGHDGRFWRPLWHFLERRKIGLSVWYLDQIQVGGGTEYMYQVLVGNNTKLPEEALYMVRFHSFYPWHTSGAYDYLCTDKDRRMLEWVLKFNEFDLYSKGDVLPDIDGLKPYYQSLIDKYCPGKLKW